MNEKLDQSRELMQDNKSIYSAIIHMITKYP